MWQMYMEGTFLMESVLIIDDSITTRQYLTIILEGAGYCVIESVNGKEGYELFIKNRPDYIITDIFMPEMDGIEIIQKLRTEFPNAKIIAMSDGGSIAGIPYFELCSKYGVVNHITKPIRKEALFEALKNFKL
jgi:two-component system, chemotaxis family, chemotaxis protein CheY